MHSAPATQVGSPHPSSTASGGQIVLLHGLGAGGWMMRPLARRLAAEGFAVDNWAYPSVFRSIEVAGLRLAETLRLCDETSADQALYLVTHSMGGIVARYALAQYMPRKLQRMVMLAPPNRGTNVATFWAPWLGRYCPPLAQLTRAADSFVNQLPLPAGIDIGIIAATWDVLVPLDSTYLGIETDHIVLRSLHGGLVFQQQTARQIVYFLQHGRFLR